MSVIRKDQVADHERAVDDERPIRIKEQSLKPVFLSLRTKKRLMHVDNGCTQQPRVVPVAAHRAG